MLSLLNLGLLAALAFVWAGVFSLQAGCFLLGALVLAVGWRLYEKLDWVHSEVLGPSRIFTDEPEPLDQDEKIFVMPDGEELSPAELKARFPSNHA